MIGFIVLAILAIGGHRWNQETQTLRDQLNAARTPVQPLTFDPAEIATLPAPVQRFFRAALTVGAPMIAAVNIQHRGTFNLGETQDLWKTFTSDQMIVARRPGFDWDARIAMMPGLYARVHDAYVAGEGMLHASMAGLFSLANLYGTEDLARGELMRFLAEATWYPTALLPSQGVRWKAVSDSSAEAALSDGGISVALLFTFNDAGLVESVGAEARGRNLRGKVVPTPWQGRFWNYSDRGGMHVPLDGEVAWLLPSGPTPYWRGHIERIEYEFAEETD